MKIILARLVIAVFSLTLLACATSRSGDVYSRDDTRKIQTVRMGVVESVRTVKIEGTQSNIGTATGAVVGGIAGSSVGSGGRDSAVAAVLGAVVGGIAGVMAIIGGGMLARRRLTDPRIKASSTFADNMIIVILVIQLALGLLTILPTMGHLDGSTMLKFSAWAQGIVTLQGGVAGYIADVHWIYKTHIFLGLTIFVLFPFTRLVHMLSVPVEYFGRRYQVVRKRA